jgi:MFS family permease
MGGFQMQGIARTLLVDDLTESAFLTTVVAMGFAPTMLVMSLFGGVAGDRMERRRVIQASQLGLVLIAAVVGVLIATGAVHWTHLLVASLLQGVTFAFQMPARQAVIPKLVGKGNVTNAVALNSAGMGIMTIVAPGLAGVLYGQIGPEAVYFTITGIGIVAVLMTGMIPRIPPDADEAKRSVLQNIAMGFKYVRGNRVVRLLLLASLVAAIFEMPFRMQIPIYARRLYDIQASEIGWLMALMGVGALAATLVTANLRAGHRRGPVMLVAGIGGTGLAMMLLAFFPWYLIGLFVMVGVGIAGSIRMTLGQSLVIEATDDAYRARVMSLQMMGFGLMPLGALPMGYMVDALGAEWTLLAIGIALTAITFVFMMASPSLRRLS